MAPHLPYGHPLAHTPMLSTSDFPKGRGGSYHKTLRGIPTAKKRNFSLAFRGEGVRRTGEGLILLKFSYFFVN